MGAKWQFFDVNIPKEYDEETRKDIADDIIEFVKRRSESGKDKDGKKFPGYSDAYKKSLDFKNAGKSSSVDLTLSGDMLASIDLLENRKGRLRIGFEKGSTENAKAEGNIIGSYGKKSGDPRKARDFLGISDKDLKRILKRYES